jgi:hypothetical protein
VAILARDGCGADDTRQSEPVLAKVPDKAPAASKVTIAPISAIRRKNLSITYVRDTRFDGFTTFDSFTTNVGSIPDFRIARFVSILTTLFGLVSALLLIQTGTSPMSRDSVAK